MNPFKEAKSRVRYCLTFDATDPRDFGEDHLLGPDLPNAYGPDGRRQVGEWFGGPPARSESVEDWLTHFAGMCIAEAVHEALEWFRVDGEPWLNPHGIHQHDIDDLVSELTDKLSALRGRA